MGAPNNYRIGESKAEVVVNFSSGIRVAGLVALSRLPFVAKRRVDLLGPSVFIDEGTHLGVRISAAGAIHAIASSPLADEADEASQVAYPVPCDALTFDAKGPGLPDGQVVWGDVQSQTRWHPLPAPWMRRARSWDAELARSSQASGSPSTTAVDGRRSLLSMSWCCRQGAARFM